LKELQALTDLFERFGRDEGLGGSQFDVRKELRAAIDGEPGAFAER
jgi:hypothetical protein